MANFFSKFFTPDPEQVETELVFILLPGAIEPEKRDTKFGDPLDAELRLAGVGYVSGGGSLLSELDQDERREIIYAGIDVDTTDVDSARTLLRDHLPELECPVGTRVQYGDRQDRYDGSTWLLDEPRSDDL